MKKIALFLILIFAFTLAACAQQVPTTEPTPAPEQASPIDIQAEPQQTVEMIEGVVVEITEDGLLIANEAQGDVQVLLSEETVMQTSDEIAIGDYVYIDYDGQMTFSLPAQISASLVRMHKIEGEIIEVYAEENAVLISDAESGEVYVRMPEIWKDSEIDFAYMTVYFDGVMTMSLPGQINAGLVIPGYSIQGAISEIADGYVMIGEGVEAIQVAITEGQLPETAEIGAVVRVIYDGQMTRSIPAQISATEIVQLSR